MNFYVDKIVNGFVVGCTSNKEFVRKYAQGIEDVLEAVRVALNEV